MNGVALSYFATQMPRLLIPTPTTDTEKPFVLTHTAPLIGSTIVRAIVDVKAPKQKTLLQEQ